MSSNRKSKAWKSTCAWWVARALRFFRNFGGNVVAAISHLGEEPSINDLIGSVKVMLDAYLKVVLIAVRSELEQVRQHHDAKSDRGTARSAGGDG